MRRRGRDEESDDDDDDVMDSQSQSQSSSPLRRSSRGNRRATTSDHSDDDEDEDSDQATSSNNRNRNRNRNRNHRNANNSDSEDDADSDVVHDEHKNELATEADLSDDEEDDQDDLDMDERPDFASILPAFMSKLGDKSYKISEDLKDPILDLLIDTASSLAEYNHSHDDFKTHAQQLKSTMHEMLDLMTEAKIEKELYVQMADKIREGVLDAADDSQSQSQSQNNPTVTGDWSGFLDSERAALAGEVNGNGAVSTDGAAQIKAEMRALREEHAQLFKDSITRDEIEGFESDEEEDNHNRGGHGGEEDEESDDDLEIERGGAGENVGLIKCPLTMQVMREPVKSKVCKHTFERSAIFGFIDSKVSKHELVECPCPGCQRVLSKDGFIRDVKVERLIKAHNRRKQEADDEDDDDQMFDLTVAD